MYYDAEGEERKARNQAIKEELGIKNEGEYKTGITRGSMRHYIKNQKRSKRNSNVRLIIILAILFFFAYILLIR